MVKVAWVIDEDKDNVATILSHDVKKGTIISVKVHNHILKIEAKADIPYGHKIAIKPIKKGETVLKYGLSIGRAIEDIEVGEHVHIHNIESMRGRGDLVKKGESHYHG